MRRRGYESSRPATDLGPPPPGPAPGSQCRHDSVDTFASGAGRRVDVCMVCDRVLRHWVEGDPPRQPDPSLKGYIEEANADA